MPAGVPAGAESAGRTDEESAAEPPMVEPKRTRNWGAIFQKTFDKINKSFTAAEDEEIGVEEGAGDADADRDLDENGGDEGLNQLFF